MKSGRWSIVVTQSGYRGQALTHRLQAMGHEAMHCPLIETVTLSALEIATATAELPDDVDGWLFTSATAARVFVASYRDWPNWRWGQPVCYCIGEATAAACKSAGLQTVVYDCVKDAEGLADAMLRDSEGRYNRHTYVFVRGVQARSALADKLSGAGHRVYPLVVYDTRSQALTQTINWQAADHLLWLLFSPSGVRALFENLPNFRELAVTQSHRALAFGKTTKQALAAAGVHDIIVAPRTTHEALMDTIQVFFTGVSGG